MTDRLLNRFSAADKLVDRYVAGAKPSEFTAAERVELREALMRSPHYTNARSPHHERLSLDVRDLFRVDAGADLLDAGLGTVATPAPDATQTAGESLFKS